MGSGRFHVDLLGSRLRLGALRQRDRQDALLESCLYLVGINAFGNLERALK